MKGNGLKAKGMGKVDRYGLMVVSIKVNSIWIVYKAKVFFIIQMETFILVIGQTTKLMAMESSPSLMGPATRDNGKMTSNMDKVKNHGQMALIMLAIILKVINICMAK